MHAKGDRIEERLLLQAWAKACKNGHRAVAEYVQCMWADMQECSGDDLADKHPEIVFKALLTAKQAKRWEIVQYLRSVLGGCSIYDSDDDGF